MKLRMCGAVLVCIMVLVGAIACSSSGGKAPNGMTGTDILAMSNNISMNTSQSTLDWETNAMGQEGTTHIVMAADNASREMYMVATSNQSQSEIGMYIVDDWLYMSVPTAQLKWIKTALTEDIWNREYNSIQELQLTKGFIDAKYIGMEDIGGVNCYKIDVKPNLDAIFNESGVSATQNIISNDTSCCAWIAENTYFHMKVTLNMTIEMETLSQKYTMSENISMVTSSISKPVTIVLPAEAQNATAISYATFESGSW